MPKNLDLSSVFGCVGMVLDCEMAPNAGFETDT